MNNAQIASRFEEIADLLEFDNANPFRVRAYRNGARVINDLTESMPAIIADPDRELTDIDGIGKDLAQKIITLLETGQLEMHQELLAKIPSTVLALLRIPGLGPKKAAVLHHELGIGTLDQLKAACDEHQVRELKGFGDKTEALILEGLDLAKVAEKRIYWAEADVYAQSILEYMHESAAVEEIQFAGSYRRGCETIGDLDLLVVSDEWKAVMDHFGGFDEVADVIARGTTKMSVRLSSGLQVDLRVVPAESFGAALQYFTGSKQHNVVLRGLAKSHGLKINEYGVFRGEKSIAGRTEEEVYATLDLPCFPPELREARQEFDWAAAGELPKLIELGDIRGDLHMHTTESDGRASLEEMCAAAKKRGLKYIAITDHSKRVSMANGLDGRRLRKQWAAIDRLNSKIKGIVVLKGVEMDILENGELDLPDDVLREADWVVASIHYGQNQSRDKITKRILGAVANPYVCAIAHPTGRLINRRKPYEVDLEAVCQAASRHGKFLELNANPARLDLNDVHCAAAKKHGVPIVICTDAHRVTGLDCMQYGVQQARRGGLTKQDVANTCTWAQLKKRIGKKR